MATAKKKPSTVKKTATAKKAAAASKRAASEQQEYTVRVKLGLIVFIMLAFSFLLIVLTKYQ